MQNKLHVQTEKLVNGQSNQKIPYWTIGNRKV